MILVVIIQFVAWNCISEIECLQLTTVIDNSAPVRMLNFAG